MLTTSPASSAEAAVTEAAVPVAASEAAASGRSADGDGEPLPAMARPRLPAAGRKPHICFVAPEAWSVFSGDTRVQVGGGAEVQQSILIRLLAGAGYPVSMICFDYGQPARVDIDGVAVFAAHRLDAGMPVLRFIHPRLTGMWKALRQVDADIYYQRSAGMLTAVVAAYCRHSGKRSIYAGASDSDFVPGQQMIRFRRDRWLFERGLRAVDTVIVQNDKQQRDCLAHYGRRSTLIPSCYDLPATARPQPGRYVLWVGNLGVTKRPDLFLEIARRLPQQRFVMIGGVSGTAAGDAERYAAARDTASRLDNVEFKGFLPLAEADTWFDHALLVVNTSVFEGMPNVFLQAWARGVPTLAFSDIVARLDGKPICPVVADVDAAVAEIEHLLSDDLHRARTGARCREYFTRTHGSAEVLARYAEVLDGLADGKG